MPASPELPENATHSSHIRFDLARQLAANCPHNLAAAIALTGSSARGLAEPASDAELVFWAESLPPLAARADWLMGAGVTALEAEPSPRSDASEWFGGSYGGVEFEAGWQTLDALANSLAPLRTGSTSDPGRLRLGELVVSAIVLRPDDRLLELQRELTLYPDALRDLLLAELTAQLTDTARWVRLERLAQRGERLAAMQASIDMLRAAVRLLYLVNRRWEAGDKWLLSLAADFPIMPRKWKSRLDSALTAPPLQAVALTHEWCDDALSLSR